MNIKECTTNCEEGFEYKIENVDDCCGSCVATQCVIEGGILIKPGETLKNTACETNTCKIVNNRPLVITSTSCPPIPNDCPEENIKMDKTGCCKTCQRCKDSQNLTRNIGEVWSKDRCTSCLCKGNYYHIFKVCLRTEKLQRMEVQPVP